MRATKNYVMHVKATDDSQGLIEAYGSIFDYEDQGGDIVRPGAFKRTITNSKSRVADGKAKFLIPMLWQHNEKSPIGGWYDLFEDNKGLLCKGQIILTTQLGKEAYELIKAGVVNEFSIGYDIPKGGANYDKSSGVRNLTEVRLWEISPVTFAMNDEALLVGVKSASGKTSWPLGDRNAAWDNGAAHGRVMKWASGEDGKIDQAKMKSVHFWYDSASPENATAYKLLFCDVSGDSVKAMPRAIFACAAALQGSRGNTPDIDDVEGVKSKVASYYHRMAEEFKHPSIKVPWTGDDGKGTGPGAQKDYAEDYQEAMARDALEDLNEVVLSALLSAMCECLCNNDPKAAMQQCLSQFSSVVMSQWLPQALQAGVQELLAPMTYNDQYQYMSAQRELNRKAGRAISASNAQMIGDHCASVKSMADEALKSMKALHKTMHDAADSLQSSMMPGANQQEEESESEETSKGAVVPSAQQTHNAQKLRPSDGDTANEEEAAAALLALFSKK